MYSVQCITAVLLRLSVQCNTKLFSEECVDAVHNTVLLGCTVSVQLYTVYNATLG